MSIGSVAGGAAQGSSANPWQYAGVYAIYATAMIAWADSGNGEIATALAWLVFVGAVVHWWNPLASHLGALTGANITSVPSGTSTYGGVTQ